MGQLPGTQRAGGRAHVAINQWSVGAIRGRDKQKASVSFDEELAELAADGINGLEPGLGSADQVGPLAAQLKKHGLELRSIYTGSALDDRAKVGKEIDRIVALAKSAKDAGTRIIVTNPSPLPNRQGKSDEQLKTQAAALDKLGHELAAVGVTLAYHNHDVELQHAAREFHHMMLGTDPRAEPVSRRPLGLPRCRPFPGGIVRRRQTLRPRIAELHLRQSTGHVWSETFGDGDIDYRELVKRLVEAGVRPLVVLDKVPRRERRRRWEPPPCIGASVGYVREVFGCLARQPG